MIPHQKNYAAVETQELPDFFDEGKFNYNRKFCELKNSPLMFDFLEEVCPGTPIFRCGFGQRNFNGITQPTDDFGNWTLSRKATSTNNTGPQAGVGEGICQKWSSKITLLTNTRCQ